MYLFEVFFMECSFSCHLSSLRCTYKTDELKGGIKMNEFNTFNRDEEIRSTEMTSDKVIPAVVRAKKKGGKAKVVVLTAAVAFASFGAGSLYTSYNWIQQKEAALTEAMKEQSSSQLPTTHVSQTAANMNNGNNMSVAQVADMASASVVEITTESVQRDMFMRQYVSEGAGSGVIISEDGYIVTNNHVIDGASKITVRLKDGNEYKGKLIGRDSQTDLAVVKIEAKDLQAVSYGNSDELIVGTTAIAIGNPLGQLGGTVTNGIISATDRQIQLENQTMTLLQTNAAINPGNSGGGLFNDRGQLIGIVVAKAAQSNVEGLGFAIPVNVVKDVVKSLMDVGYVQGRPVLGVNVVDVNSPQLARYYGVSQQGVYIAKLTEGTKSEESGLKVGDCIIAVDDSQISSMADLTSILKGHKVGDVVKVTVSRSGKLLTANVELSESVPTAETANTDNNEQEELPQQDDSASGQDELREFFDFFGGNSGADDRASDYFFFNGQ